MFCKLQKEMQGVDAPFYYLANEFYKTYQERIEVFRSLGMQWLLMCMKDSTFRPAHSISLTTFFCHCCVWIFIY